jgi:hypothetical protein
MAALTSGRDTRMRLGDIRSGLVAANVKLFPGALLMRVAAGHVTKGATATGSVGIGRCEELVDNTGGAAGAVRVKWRPGIFLFANSAAGDAITIAEIGDVCFIVDDQTVAKTNGSSTRSPAGIIEDVDSSGVWVRCDEALTKAS